jgi:hypothetical protein
MIHLSDLNLLRFNLIEIGALLQLMAVGAHLREQSIWGRLSRTRKTRRDDLESQGPDRPGDRPEHNAGNEINAGNFPNTDKPKFVQSFTFRSGRLQRR